MNELCAKCKQVRHTDCHFRGIGWVCRECAETLIGPDLVAELRAEGLWPHAIETPDPGIGPNPNKADP